MDRVYMMPCLVSRKFWASVHLWRAVLLPSILSSTQCCREAYRYLVFRKDVKWQGHLQGYLLSGTARRCADRLAGPAGGEETACP
jgi:hypothetical protein